jgi:hypothetical protein
MVDAVFDRPASFIQREILDYLDRARERPVGHTSAFVRACRERFAEPLRLTARPSQVITGAAFLLVIGGFFGWLAVEVRRCRDHSRGWLSHAAAPRLRPPARRARPAD